MKLTEKMLLDGYDGLTGGMDRLSIVDGKEVRWNYRHDTFEDDGYDCVCDSRDKANHITLEYDRVASIDLDDDCANHPALARIASDEAKLVGGEL